MLVGLNLVDQHLHELLVLGKFVVDGLNVSLKVGDSGAILLSFLHVLSLHRSNKFILVAVWLTHD